MATLMLRACPHVQTGFDLSLLEHSAPLLPALPTSLGSLLLGSVGDRVVFKEPFLRGRGHSCKLAVKHGLFVLGHDEVLWDDHCLRKALIDDVEREVVVAADEADGAAGAAVVEPVVIGAGTLQGQRPLLVADRVGAVAVREGATIPKPLPRGVCSSLGGSGEAVCLLPRRSATGSILPFAFPDSTEFVGGHRCDTAEPLWRRAGSQLRWPAASEPHCLSQST